MNQQGFLKVASAVPKVRVANLAANVQQIVEAISEANDDGASIVALPEMAVTAYTCADLFLQPHFLEEAESALDDILSLTHTMPVVAVVGMPVAHGNKIFNCAVVIASGEVKGVVPKTYLPNYGEFYEARWFSSSTEAPSQITLCGQTVPMGRDLLFRIGGVVIGIEICEDLWVPVPPSSHMALAGAEVIINLSASDEVVCKHDYLRSLVAGQSARLVAGYVYSSAGFGESSTDLVFAGNAMICENGAFLAESKRFQTDPQVVVGDIDILKLRSQRLRLNTFANVDEKCEYRFVDIEEREDAEKFDIDRTFDRLPFIPSDERTMDERCSEIFNIQVMGFAQRLLATHTKRAVVGISGGLDSTLALLVACRTMDKLGLPRTNVLGITMPGFGTTGRTHRNAVNLIRALGAELREINIGKACKQHFADIGLPESDRSVTYENSQARERTQILMDVANKEGGLVVGTGDLSELALGWATYNGDHMSMYGVNCGVPKTLVRHLVQWVASDGTDEKAAPILLDIADTPISPELLPADEQGNIAQKTEDLVGPYELHDFFLYNFVRFGFSPSRLFFMASRAFDGQFSRSTIKKWLIVFLRRFFNQQFKRSALPDGPKVGSVSLSPRGDWRMPSDAKSDLWLAEAENIDA